MPLLKGNRPDVIRSNYKELKNTGKYSDKQCWAIAMKTARKSTAMKRVKKMVK